jgi:hypothetical protein
VYVIWYNWQMYTGGCDTSFRHPTTSPEGIFSDTQIAKADSGFYSKFYFHKK